MNLNSEKLDVVNETTFLGLVIDSKLQWKPQLTNMIKKLSAAAYATRKIRQLTDVQTARLIYFSNFHSHLSYGILLWGRAADINTIFTLQKRAIRAIYNLGSRASLRDIFKDINIMTVPSLYLYENIMHVRKNIHMFIKNKDIHNVNTRNKDKLVVQKFRLEKTSKCFMGSCIRIYNKIPESIKQYTERKFKNIVKQTLTKKAYYKIDDYFSDRNIWTI